MLTSSTLLRAHVVYLSYYMLGAPIYNSSTTLQQSLLSKGVFTSSALDSALSMVKTARL